MKTFLFILCIALVSCNGMKPIGVVVIPRGDIERSVRARFGLMPLIDDDRYHTIHRWEIEKADHEAWRQWLSESWDCDDQSAEIVRWLRLDAAKKHRNSAPAAGRVNGRRMEDGVKHGFVWWMDSNREINVWDATKREPSNISGRPFYITDK
jgi:hypothetical protein